MRDEPLPRLPLRVAALVLGIVLIAVGFSETILVRYGDPILLIAACLTFGPAAIERFPEPGRTSRLGLTLAIVTIIAAGGWFIGHWFPLKPLAQAGAITSGFHALHLVGRLKSIGDVRRTWMSRVGQVLVLVALALVALVGVLLVATTIAADPANLLLAKLGKASNSFTAPATTRTLSKEGWTRINDIRYGAQFPNSFLDIYLGPTGAPRPTYIYIHGGGFILGDKVKGDPNTGPRDFYAGHQAHVLDLGYNVVQINYALAPAFRYPTPLIQASQAIAFLEAHGAEFGLDMNRVVIGGGSAGGHIAAQFALVQTNPAYATELGLKPVVPRQTFKGLVLESAPVDILRSLRTEAPDAWNDLLFDLASRSYYGIADSGDVRSARLAQADIALHVTPDFPPTFLGDGNYGTFPIQTLAFADRLRALKVPVSVVLFPLKDAKLGHGFMFSPGKYTDLYLAKKRQFLLSLAH